MRLCKAAWEYESPRSTSGVRMVLGLINVIPWDRSKLHMAY